MTALLILAGVVVVSIVHLSVFIWIGGMLAQAPRATWGRAVFAALALLVASLVLKIMEVATLAAFPKARFFEVALVACCGLIAQVCLTWLILRKTQQTSVGGTWLVWGITFMSSVVMLAAVSLVVRPYLIEGFMSPSNAMCPALLGNHRVGRCPHCSQSMVISASELREKRGEQQSEQDGICINCLKSGTLNEYSQIDGPPDRFFVDKTASPQRWDIIAYYRPQREAELSQGEPPIKYVHRLVGLPGESLVIKEGSVWIDGEKLAMPAELTGLEYVSTEAFEELGTPDNPLVLNNDQYCVLGDFSKRSLDSRIFGPVPKENLIGVVTIRYWPLARFRIWK